MRRVLGTVAGVVAAALLAGCGSSAVPLAAPRRGDPAGRSDWPGPTAGEHLLVSDGRLYSEQTDAGACFWFVSATGPVVSLHFPSGWSAGSKPLHVVDPAGRTVASTFDEGLGFRGHFETGATGCSPGGLSRSFAVTAVEQAGVPAR